MRKWFSVGIFKEGLRQLRLSGFSVIAVFTVLNLLPPISIWSTNVSDWEPRMLQWGLYGIFPAIFCVAAPILLCSILFRFVMRRSDSDFYGALPFTRQSIFCSFTAAILAYVVSGVLLSVLLNIFLFWMMGCYIISFGEVVLVMLTVLTAAMLVAGALLVGIMLCGRLFNAFFTGGLLLCLPRAVATFFLFTCSRTMNWQLNVDEVLLPRVLQQNTLIKLLTSWGIDKADVFPWQSILYSFVLALVYIVLAGVLFYFRKSEIAGESVPFPWLQVVCRLGISLPLMLFLTVLLILGEAENVALIIIGILCLLVYYVYELLTTKSWRRLIPATGWLLASLGACLVFTGTVVGYNRYHIAQQPTQEEISYISIANINNHNSYGVRIRDYMKEPLYNIRFEAASARQIVSNALKEQMQGINPLETSYIHGAVVRVKIVKNDGGVLYRKLKLNETQFNMILSTSPAYEACIASIPTVEEFKRITYNANGEFPTQIISSPQVYEVFRKEYLSLPIKRRVEMNDPHQISGSSGMYIEIQFGISGKTYNETFVITAKEFPQTFVKLAEQCDTDAVKRYVENTIQGVASYSIYAAFYRDNQVEWVLRKNQIYDVAQLLLQNMQLPLQSYTADKGGYLLFSLEYHDPVILSLPNDKYEELLQKMKI